METVIDLDGAPPDLETIAHETDEAMRTARSRLVDAVRLSHRMGLTQAEIARRIGRSQPEVSRLLRFHGTGPLAMRLRRNRAEVLRTIGEAGGSDVRVFGSVATGHEREDSDIDLLFHMGQPLSLMDLGRLEHALATLLSAPVDTVPDTSIAPYARDRILREAVPL
ncbi:MULTISPECIES: nucleotidyltransferase domain-containing protein [unclassified Actinomyces]|uniref:nucleotidyltransferase domain-containing protein n=1 Tax=unclassified Actinomyces TaxID=2609248 RepID=UPI002016E27F|nr:MULTISPECIES: nucleotidyltransferase domain-containing protein [unclassified Actinomyces]MCL3777256.1 nucleotidyltransferase domain-containing protein [Actinomyces sp. AC-20-1]MCL3789531.1 nucleotidyltransferase domain-containing protein [Actinomyces sp. 187325]MCL3792361.1 nucleotidyltransferase domain-containing protein [Actinomyces sp. 186855]MCL3793617.1 nucleotidyltransferase domain-containing protein [Actinomyces sp. 217892]